MRNPWASTFDITKAWPTTQTSCTASIRGLRELFLTRTRSSTWTSTLTAGQPSLSFSSFSSVFLENWMLWFNTHPLNIYEGKQTSQSFFLLDWPLIVLPEIKKFSQSITDPSVIQRSRQCGNKLIRLRSLGSGEDSPLTQNFPFLWCESMSLCIALFSDCANGAT